MDTLADLYCVVNLVLKTDPRTMVHKQHLNSPAQFYSRMPISNEIKLISYKVEQGRSFPQIPEDSVVG